jgi:hypothetical protein
MTPVADGEPALRILTMRPLTVAGTDFRPGERVRVVVTSAGDETVRKIRADTVGAFEVSFDDVRTGRSVPELSVAAAGDRGSRVSFALNQPQGRAGDLRV